MKRAIDIDSVFSPGGGLDAVLPSYSFRDGQLEMAESHDYEFTFTWSVEGRNVTIDNWSDDLNGGGSVYWDFYEGEISPTFDSLSLTKTNYNSYDFTLIPRA